ncbi:MAG: branched-chain amino acid ABC transporter permease [Chloroflexi bacterium]|nr:branched-chain amino acid ABC transporter permease [Chloroflexota bacterium]
MDGLGFLIPKESTQMMIGVNIILAWSFYIMISTGQLSLGNSAFMALGAYGAGVATVNFKLPLLVALIIAIAIGGLFGTLVSFPALRVRGMYLAMMTIGVEEVVQSFFRNFDYVGGATGFRGMKGVTVWMVALAVVLMAFFIWRLESSRLGRSFEAVRDDEMVANTMGLNTTYIKVLAFAIGAAMASLAGALYAHFILFIAPEHFDFWQSILPTFYVILGGVQTLWGAALGAVILTLLPEYFRPLKEWWIIVYGLAIVAMMAYRPQGLISKSVTLHIAKAAKSLIRARAPGATEAREAAQGSEVS